MDGERAPVLGSARSRAAILSSFGEAPAAVLKVPQAGGRGDKFSPARLAHHHQGDQSISDGISQTFNMEQIETQATDLRYLTQAPVPLANATSASPYSATTPHPQPPHHQASPGGSASFGDNSAPTPNPVPAPAQTGNATSNKRKSLDDGSTSKQTRSKRNRVGKSPWESRFLTPPTPLLWSLPVLTIPNYDRRLCSISPLLGT